MGKYFSEFIYVISKDVDLHKKCSSIFKYISFFDGVLFLSFKGFDREINLTKSSLRPSEHDFEFVYRVAVDFFDEIFEGVASEDDVVWNCRKIRFYNKEKESSPLM